MTQQTQHVTTQLLGDTLLTTDATDATGAGAGEVVTHGAPGGGLGEAPAAGHDPVSDVRRLSEIGRFDFESPELKASLDRLAEEAAQLMGLHIGLVSIVLEGAQMFAGSHGLGETWLADAGGTPIEWSFCANAVRSGAPYVVANAPADALHSDNPLVVFDGITSYAGAPLLTASGHVLGTCCAIGSEPREFSPADVSALQELSARIVLEIERYSLDDLA